MGRIVLLAAALAAWACDDGGSDPPDPVDASGRADMNGQIDMQAADMPSMADMLADMSSTADMLADMTAIDMATIDMAPDAGPMVAMGVNPGQRAPDFSLLDADGNAVALSDFAGRPVMIAGASAW